MGICRVHRNSSRIVKPRLLQVMCLLHKHALLRSKKLRLQHGSRLRYQLHCPIVMRVPGRMMMHGCIIPSNAYLKVVGLFFSTLKWATQAGP